MERSYKPCMCPGCPELILNGGYCSKHKRQTTKTYNQSRDPDTQRLYNSSKWKALRERFKARNPLCNACQQEGRTTAGIIVDHIAEYKPGDNFYDWNNLQNLCSSCHNVKHKGGKTVKGTWM